MHRQNVCVCVSLQSVCCVVVVMSGGWFAAELRAHDVELHTIDAFWLSAEAATIAIECSTKRAKKNSIWFEMANCIAECLQEMKSRENDYHLFFLKIAMVFFVEVIASHGIHMVLPSNIWNVTATANGINTTIILNLCAISEISPENETQRAYYYWHLDTSIPRTRCLKCMVFEHKWSIMQP